MSWTDRIEGQTAFDTAVKTLKALDLQVSVEETDTRYWLDGYGYDSAALRIGRFTRADGAPMIVEEWTAKRNAYPDGSTDFLDVAIYREGARPVLEMQVFSYFD